MQSKCNVCAIHGIAVLTSLLNYVIIDMGLSLTNRGTVHWILQKREYYPEYSIS
jgi:hypothetical protein